MTMPEFLLALVLILLAAKLASEGIERLGQTAVLGELLAGILIGPGVLGLVHESEILRLLAEIGVILLLFEIGLESDLSELVRVGTQAAVVALAGVLTPMGLGYLVGVWWGFSPRVAVFLGATLTATSVGITARVLSDLGRLQEASSRVVLGAALIDDILGLIILALVAGLAETGQVSPEALAFPLAKAIAFIILAIVLGIRFAPALLRWVGRMRARGSLIVYAVLFCLVLALISEQIGLATIIGAFAAGLVLARTERRAHIEELIKPVADLFVPIFFVMVGMQVQPAALNPLGESTRAIFWFGMLLSAIAVISKLAAGLAVYQKGVRRWPVGVGMIPRGEVGLIFAGIGLSRGVIDPGLYAACVGMVMITTIITPLWLQILHGKRN